MLTAMMRWRMLVGAVVIAGASLPQAPQEVHEVSGEYALHVRRRVAARREERAEFLQIGNAVEIQRRLLGAVAAVQVAADADMLRVARELADVVDVLADFLELQIEVCRLRAKMRPGERRT